MINVSHIFILLCGCFGLFIATYIRYIKTSKKGAVCYAGSGYNNVVSVHSKFLGFPVELLGMIFYAFIVFSYSVFVLFPATLSNQWLFLILLITTGGLLFSAYLTFIQFFVLRSRCLWCLASTVYCFTIFVIALWSVPVGLSQFLLNFESSIFLIYGLALAVGIGVATIVDILFLRFLKDLKISQDELDVLKTISQVMWVVLGVMIMSLVGIFIPAYEHLLVSAEFWFHVAILIIITVNALLLNLWISPYLLNISFSNSYDEMSSKTNIIRRFAFASGSLSVVSWYSLFIIKNLEPGLLSVPILIICYVSLVVIAVVISQVALRSFVVSAR